jgi:lipopolysaccharide transport system ATP-binding protein
MTMHNEEPIIVVKHLSKQYRIGLDRTYKTFSESAVNVMKSPVKALKKLRQRTDTFWALKDINFEVQRGEVVGIIGRNGAGKTTLLKILARITHPTEGEVVLRGRVGSLLEVGTGFHPELTGRENIYFNGAILGMTKKEIEAKFDEIVDFSGVEQFLDTPLKRYSSGMQVRLAFSVAAHLEPEILLVDEVLAVGDAEFQKKCLGKMGEVAKEGRTVLFVSHNMAAIQNLCRRCILLKDGKINGIGEAKDIVTKYLSTISELTQIPLKDRTDRKGNGLIRITNVIFQNAKRETVNHFISGEDAYILLEYESKSNDNLNNVDVALSVDNSSGERIFTLYSEFTNDTFYKVGKNGFFVCYVPNLPFTSGKYSFTIFLNIQQEICDWVINAGSFQVEDGDYFKTGKVQNRGQGCFLVKHKWLIE